MKNINIKFKKRNSSTVVVLLNGWVPSKNNRNYTQINGKTYWIGTYKNSFRKIECISENNEKIIKNN